jgi:hypothetical protein
MSCKYGTGRRRACGCCTCAARSHVHARRSYAETSSGYRCPEITGFQRHVGETFWTEDLLGTCGRSGSLWSMERLAAECKARCDCKGFNENGCFKKTRGVQLVEVEGNPNFCHYEALPRAECGCPSLPSFKVSHAACCMLIGFKRVAWAISFAGNQ